MLSGVKHIFLVLSGKGGVGKSTVSTQLALTLKEQGYKVGILDIDLCGPSVPFLLNIEDAEVCQCPEGWLPVYTDENKNLAVMSIAFLLKSRNDSIVWRGPKKTSMIRQFINDVYWNEIDYLIIDTPPGTSDEHITVMECLKEVDFDGAVIVTSPQEISLEDVRKEITFCKKTGIKILGVIENLSGNLLLRLIECSQKPMVRLLLAKEPAESGFNASKTVILRLMTNMAEEEKGFLKMQKWRQNGGLTKSLVKHNINWQDCWV